MELNRRDLLAAFLGVPFANACRRDEVVTLPPGGIVGASHASGHRLREPMQLQPRAWQARDVVIVGGGVAGLSAAWRLAHAGVTNFSLLELEPELGGTSRSGRSSVSAFPWGAHYVPVPSAENRALVRLLGEMGVMSGGVVGEEFLCGDPEERTFFRGRWYEGLYLYAGASPEDLRQLRAFETEIDRWVAWKDGRGRRAFTIPMAYGSDDAEVTALDRTSMAAWMDGRGFNSPRLRWFVDYACRDDYGSTSEDVSAWAGLFYFASRVDRPGDESRSFITWPEGNGRLVSHLAQSARGQVSTGTLVADLRPGPEGVEVIALRGGEPIGFRAQRVIFAGPQFVAGHVIAPWREKRPDHLAAFSYGSWMVANLTLRDRPAERGFPAAWDNVLYESPSLGYVVATHQGGSDRGPTVFTYYYPLTDSPVVARQRLLSAGREEWAEVALSDLSRAHPEIRSLTQRLDVMRWGHAMVRPVPGFVWSASRRAAAEPFRGIHFAHSDLSGVALFEEAFYRGVRVAEDVMTAMGRPGATFL